MKPASALKVVLLIAGVLIGSWQGFVGLQTIFVMKEEWLLLIALIIGPFSILPAVLVSMWRPRFGGWWLICAGVGFSLLALLHPGLEISQLKSAAFRFSLPMVLLGIGFVLTGKLASSMDQKVGADFKRILKPKV